MRKRLRKKMAKPWLEMAARYASAPSSFWVNAPQLAHDRYFEALVRSAYFSLAKIPHWSRIIDGMSMTLKPVMVQKGVVVGFTTGAITGGSLKCFSSRYAPVGCDDKMNVVAMDEAEND